MDIPPERFLSRIENRSETERYEKLEVLKRVRENYFAAFEKFPDENVAVIDNDKPLAEAAEKVYLAVKALL